MWLPNDALDIAQLVHHRFIFSGPFVLGKSSLNIQTNLVDSNQPGLRRFEPNSCNVLIGGQPNPWNLLQLQDTLSRHRGANPFRRYELSEKINLLSPG